MSYGNLKLFQLQSLSWKAAAFPQIDYRGFKTGALDKQLISKIMGRLKLMKSRKIVSCKLVEQINILTDGDKLLFSELVAVINILYYYMEVNRF